MAWLGRALLAVIAAGSLAGAHAAAEESAALGPAAGGSPSTQRPSIEAPRILGEGDIARYKRIFAVQDDGRWREADRLIAELDDDILMGHVLAQRYLHPTKYRSRYAELSRWLGRYADHPEAERIHRLALRRKPASARAPRAPQPPSPPERAEGTGNDRTAVRPLRRRTVTAAERSLVAQVRRYVGREYLSVAERYVAKHTDRVSAAGIARARGIIAGGWFRWGDTRRAYRLAGAAAERAGTAVAGPHWWAGVAAYKLGRFGEAALHFEDAARASADSAAAAARASFWAARAHLVGGQPERVNTWLRQGARYPRTFYGMIAAHVLGAEPRFSWRPEGVAPADLRRLLGAPAVRRALALAETGEHFRAERELRPLARGGGARHLRALAAVADAARLPAAAMRAAKTLQRLSGEVHDGALYPVPGWDPDGGYSIDRALIYALARQESEFNPRARSPRGARGLMQLMPATARYMSESRRAFRGRHGKRLYDPDINLALGQKYVDYLLTGEFASGNMVLTIAAYNGGPGNAGKWHRKGIHEADALLFIEAIPLGETRLFVKRVLENLWIYRARLGQEAPSLTALAEGRWPFYVGLDGEGLGVAEEHHQHQDP